MRPGKLTFSQVPEAAFPETEWRSLVQAGQSHNIFYHPDFVQTAANIWPAARPHGFIVGKQGQQIQVLQPYRLIRNTLGTVLETLRLPTSDRNAPILAPDAGPEALSSMYDFIAQQLKPDLLIARSVDESVYRHLCKQFENFDLRTINEAQGYIRYLAPSVDAFWARFNSKDRNQLKRRIRKGEEAGLEFRIVDTDRLPAGYSLTEALKHLSRLHRLRFEAKDKPSFFLQPEYQAFYKQLCISTGLDGLWMTFTEALYQGEVVGSMLGVRNQDYYIYLMIGFDPRFEACSPGHLMIYHTIQDLIQKSVRAFDFKCGDESYKDKWTKNFYKKYRLFVSFSPKGSMLAYVRLGMHYVQRLNRVPNKLNGLFNQLKWRPGMIIRW